MLVLIWAICVFCGVMLTAKILAKQEMQSEQLDS